MAFPELKPTSRDFKPGTYAIKTFNAQSGAEVRILYGDTRTKMELSLGYDNISDTEAEQFLTHYDETKGTFSTFGIPHIAKFGWGGTAAAIGAFASGNTYRYADAPQVTSVRPGRSSVRVSLVGVFSDG
jgi:hypothetical protein